MDASSSSLTSASGEIAVSTRGSLQGGEQDEQQSSPVNGTDAGLLAVAAAAAFHASSGLFSRDASRSKIR